MIDTSEWKKLDDLITPDDFAQALNQIQPLINATPFQRHAARGGQYFISYTSKRNKNRFRIKRDSNKIPDSILNMDQLRRVVSIKRSIPLNPTMGDIIDGLCTWEEANKMIAQLKSLQEIGMIGEVYW